MKKRIRRNECRLTIRLKGSTVGLKLEEELYRMQISLVLYGLAPVYGRLAMSTRIGARHRAKEKSAQRAAGTRYPWGDYRNRCLDPSVSGHGRVKAVMPSDQSGSLATLRRQRFEAWREGEGHEPHGQCKAERQR